MDAGTQNQSGRSGVESAETPPSSEVFLTPRVLDRRVYDEMVSSLTGLIERADEQTRRAAGAAGTAGELRSALREAARALQATVGSAGVASQGLDERIAKSAALLKRIESALESGLGPAIDAAEARLEKLVAQAEQRISVRERAAVESVESAEARLRATTERAERLAGDLQERFEQQADAALSLVAGAASEPKRAADAPADLDDAIERGEALAERVEQTGFFLAELRDQADEAQRTLSESLLDRAATVDRLLERQGALGDEMTRLQSIQAQHEQIVVEHMRAMSGKHKG